MQEIHVIRKYVGLLLLLSVAVFGEADAQAEIENQIATKKSSPQVLNWDDLMPAGEEELLRKLYEEQYKKSLSMGHGSEEDVGDMQLQLGTFNVVEALNGKQVRLPGFIVPLEYVEGGKISEFLLVPYFGACIHSPPPPPNQVVYITTDKPQDLAEIWDPVWITGIMRTEKNINDVGSAAYTINMMSWENYIEE